MQEIAKTMHYCCHPDISHCRFICYRQYARFPLFGQNNLVIFVISKTRRICYLLILWLLENLFLYFNNNQLNTSLFSWPLYLWCFLRLKPTDHFTLFGYFAIEHFADYWAVGHRRRRSRRNGTRKDALRWVARLIFLARFLLIFCFQS